MAAISAQTMLKLSSTRPITSSLFSSKTTFPSTQFSSSFSLPLKLRNRIPAPLKFSAAVTPKISAAISVGEALPDSTLSYLNDADEVQTLTISDLTKGKKAVLFAVPGAFTPTCSQKHLPGFVEKAAELKSKGVDTIACISVNDAFVLKAWKKALNIGDEVLILSDGNADFTKAIGVELDLTGNPVGLGLRSRRYAMLVEDGVVKLLNLEEGGAFTFSGADDIIKAL